MLLFVEVDSCATKVSSSSAKEAVRDIKVVVDLDGTMKLFPKERPDQVIVN